MPIVAPTGTQITVETITTTTTRTNVIEAEPDAVGEGAESDDRCR